MKLGEAETLGVLDDHDRRVGDIDADLNHGGRDEHLDLAGQEPRHDDVALRRFHAAVDEADDLAQHRVEHLETLLGGRDVEDLGFLDQRADPISLGAFVEHDADAVDDLVEPVERHGARIDRLAAGGLFGEPRDVHVAVVGEHQRARDRRRGHHQHIGGAALGGEREALVDAEPVLLVDDDQREVAELDAGLEQGMRAEQEIDRAVGQPGDDGIALLAALATGEHRDRHAGGIGERLDGARMLAHQQLGRRHDRGLRAGLDDGRGGEQCHHRLARADVALQQARHPFRLGEVDRDFVYRPLLRIGEGEGQGGEHLAAQTAIAFAGLAGGAPLVLAEQRQRQLRCEQLVVGEARDVGRVGGELVGRFRMMGADEGAGERRPAVFLDQQRIEPLRQRRQLGDRVGDGLGEGLAREAGGHRVDRLDQRQGFQILVADDVVRVDHLRPAVEPFDRAAHGARLADGQLLLEVVALHVEEDQRDLAGVVMGVDAIGDAAVAGRRRAWRSTRTRSVTVWPSAALAMPGCWLRSMTP